MAGGWASPAGVKDLKPDVRTQVSSHLEPFPYLARKQKERCKPGSQGAPSGNASFMRKEAQGTTTVTVLEAAPSAEAAATCRDLYDARKEAEPHLLR